MKTKTYIKCKSFDFEKLFQNYTVHHCPCNGNRKVQLCRNQNCIWQEYGYSAADCIF